MKPFHPYVEARKVLDVILPGSSMVIHCTRKDARRVMDMAYDILKCKSRQHMRCAFSNVADVAGGVCVAYMQDRGMM